MFDLADLKKYRRYEVIMTAYNIIGESPASVPVEVFVGEAGKSRAWPSAHSQARATTISQIAAGNMETWLHNENTGDSRRMIPFGSQFPSVKWGGLEQLLPGGSARAGRHHRASSSLPRVPSGSPACRMVPAAS